MTSCTVCNTTIENNFCPSCGQKYKAGKLTWMVIVEDAVNNFFSLDSKLWSSLKLAFANPKKLVDNYLSGFRDFYFSPGRLFLLATLVFGFNFIFEDKRFFVISFGNDLSALMQLGVFGYVFSMLTIVSFIMFRKQKKSLVEHFAINLYSISTWLVVFALLAISYKLFNYFLLGGGLELLLLILFQQFWVARVLTQGFWKQLGTSLLSFLLFLVLALGLMYIVSGGDWQID